MTNLLAGCEVSVVASALDDDAAAGLAEGSFDTKTIASSVDPNVWNERGNLLEVCYVASVPSKSASTKSNAMARLGARRDLQLDLIYILQSAVKQSRAPTSPIQPRGIQYPLTLTSSTGVPASELPSECVLKVKSVEASAQRNSGEAH